MAEFMLLRRLPGDGLRSVRNRLQGSASVLEWPTVKGCPKAPAARTSRLPIADSKPAHLPRKPF